MAMGARARSFGDVIVSTQDLQPRRLWYPDLLDHKDRLHKDGWGRGSRVGSCGWCGFCRSPTGETVFVPHTFSKIMGQCTENGISPAVIWEGIELADGEVLRRRLHCAVPEVFLQWMNIEVPCGTQGRVWATQHDFRFWTTISGWTSLTTLQHSCARIN